jgi:hypothetical protein
MGQFQVMTNGIADASIARKAETGREKDHMRFKLAMASAVGLAMAGGVAHAHHSFAMFDMAKQVTVNGTVKQFQWTNPHAYIQIMAKDAAGRDVEWSMEMGAPMYLYARGWRPSSLKAGMRVSVTLNPLRNGKPGGVVREVSTADGKQIGKNT